MRVFPPLFPETVSMSALYSTAGLIHASLKGFSTCLKTNEGAQVSAALDFSAAYNLIQCVMKEEMLQIADQSYCVRGIYYPKSKMCFEIREVIFFRRRWLLSHHMSYRSHIIFSYFYFGCLWGNIPSPTGKKNAFLWYHLLLQHFFSPPVSFRPTLIGQLSQVWEGSDQCVSASAL